MITLGAHKSHNSHIIISCLSVFAFLTTLTTVSALILSSSSSHAETSSVLASVTVPDVCTLSKDSSTSTEHSATSKANAYIPDIGETVINVSCNDANGFSIYAVGYSNDTVGNTNLIGETTGSTIPTGTDTSKTVSNWAMKLTPVTGTFTPTILNDYDQYHTVPSTATKVATRTASIDVSAVSTIKTTYAVALSPAQTRDTYNGKVKYTVVHPNYAKNDGTVDSYNVPVTFAGTGVESVTFTATGYPTRIVSTSGGTVNLIKDAVYTATATFTSGYEFVSWALNNSTYGTLGSTATNPTTFTPNVNSANAVITITGQKSKLYMQNMTASDCATTAQTVYDKRDEKSYEVQILADGNCWMLDNLAIDLVSATLANLKGNTNASDVTLTYLKNGGGTSPQTAYAVATATSSGYFDRPAIATSGTCSDAYCVNNPTNSSWKWDAVTTTPINGTSSYAQGQIGIYYNYCAASAGSFCYAYSSGPSSDPDISTLQDIKEDICPKGWHLPTSTSGGEFQALYSKYSGAQTFQVALSTPLSGLFFNGKAGNQGNYGRFWSSTMYSNADFMYHLNVTSTSVNTSDSTPRDRGFSVRCVFDS